MWRMDGTISLRQMCMAARAFTVDTNTPAYDHVTIVDARAALGPSWALKELFDLAQFLHHTFTENNARLRIFILVEVEWKRGEALLFRAISRLFRALDVSVHDDEREVLQQAGLALDANLGALFPAHTHAIRT